MKFKTKGGSIIDFKTTTIKEIYEKSEVIISYDEFNSFKIDVITFLKNYHLLEKV
jgi:hypothetical protein